MGQGGLGPMGLVWVEDRGTCPPHVFGGGGQKALCPSPPVLQHRIFLLLPSVRGLAEKFIGSPRSTNRTIIKLSKNEV